MIQVQDDILKDLNVKMAKELGVKNPMALPRLTKIVVNMGVKDAVSDKKIFDRVM